MTQLRQTITMSRADTNTAWPTRSQNVPGWETQYSQTITYSDDQLVMTLVRDWQDINVWKSAFEQIDNSVDANNYTNDLMSGLKLSRTLEII